MRSKKPLGLGLLVAAAAMAAMALAASSASATIVTPTGTAITASLKAGTSSRFVLDNAFSENALFCKKSEAKFKTPEEGTQKKNQNQVGTGTFSQTQGSVSSQVESVKFEECTVRKLNPNEPHGEGIEVSKATTTVVDPTHWTIAAEAVAGANPQVAIGVPQIIKNAEGKVTNGVYIETGIGCKFYVGEDQSGANQQSVVMGSFNNKAEKEAELTIDGQVKFRVEAQNELAKKTCEELDTLSPAQFEAVYSVAGGLKVE